MFRSLKSLTTAAALALLPQVAAAQDPAGNQARAPVDSASAEQPQAQSGQPPQRIRQVTLQGNEACPTAAADEIVVCSRINPNEAYRVPKELRQPPEVPAQNQSWINRAAAADRVGRVAGGLPNTCSPIGTGGQTGCSIAAGQAWAAERRQAQREAAQAAPSTAAQEDDQDN